MSVALEKDDLTDAFGFDAAAFLKKVKDEIGVGKVRLQFGTHSVNTQGRAHATRVDGICVIDLPTREAIKQAKGFDDMTSVAKQKSALIEEAAHCACHETEHNECVVRNTVQLIREHLTGEELSLPYIQEKIRRLEVSPERVEKLQPLPS